MSVYSEVYFAMVRIWFAKVGMEELECPAQILNLNSTEHLGDELERWLYTRPPHPASVMLTAEWTQILTGPPWNLVENCLRRVEDKAAKGN